MNKKLKILLVIVCCFCFFLCSCTLCFAGTPTFTVYGNVTSTSSQFEYVKSYILNDGELLTFPSYDWCFARTGQYEYTLLVYLPMDTSDPSWEPEWGYGEVEIVKYIPSYNNRPQDLIVDFYNLQYEGDQGPLFINPYHYSILGTIDPSYGDSIVIPSDIVYKRQYETLTLSLLVALVVILAYYVFKPSVSPLSLNKGVRL